MTVITRKGAAPHELTRSESDDVFVDLFTSGINEVSLGDTANDLMTLLPHG
jgi:hypothetical protein